MNLADDVRLRQDEQVIVAFQIVGVILEAIASVIRFVERKSLDHRAHRTIQNQDARLERGVKLLQTTGGHRRIWRENRARC